MIEKQKTKPSLERGMAGVEYGTQPLDQLMDQFGLSNTDLVRAADTGLLTHKMVGKARRGRRLSRKVQTKVLEAFNAAAPKQEDGAPTAFGLADLFTYDGR
jgi:hypothetical protein